MSIYSPSSIGTDSNKVIFNGPDFPVFRVQSRAPRQRQIRDLDIPIPFEGGITDNRTLEGASAYILVGTMYPGSESDYDTGIGKLRKLASLDFAQADNESDEGYVPYTYGEFSQDKTIFVKVLYVDVPETTRTGLVQPFQLVCKVKDPTIFSSTISTATTEGSDPTVNAGSALYPFKFPIQYGASTYSTSSTAINQGDIPAYPISIKVYGPINNPTITNSTTGEYIKVNTNVPAGSILTIAYNKSSLSVDVDGVSVMGNVTSDSTYFKLIPGGNDISLNGSSFSSGAYVEVNYRSTWPLS